MSELKPCPFCGETNIELKHELFPSCARCGCVQNNVGCRNSKASWNTRTNDVQLAAAKAEIAEYRCLLDVLNRKGGLGFETHDAIEKLLAKHKGE